MYHPPRRWSGRPGVHALNVGLELVCDAPQPGRPTCRAGTGPHRASHTRTDEARCGRKHHTHSRRKHHTVVLPTCLGAPSQPFRCVSTHAVGVKTALLESKLSKIEADTVHVPSRVGLLGYF